MFAAIFKFILFENTDYGSSAFVASEMEKKSLNIEMN
jgi:hypothetical protein